MDKTWALCSVSVAAQVITFPLSAFYFHQFPAYFLLSNLLIAIPSVIIMYAGIFYLIIPQLPFISKALALVLEKTILFMNKALAVIEHWPFASINKIWLSIPEYLLLYVIIICCFYYLYDKKLRFIQLGLVCTLILCVSLSIKRINQTSTKSIAWLNLNKHKGIIFKNGNEAVVISDLKPNDKLWLYSIQPYLDSCQISKITTLNFNQDIQLAWFVKNHNFIQFLTKRIFIFNGPYMVGALHAKIKTDYIYSDAVNKKINSFIKQNFDYGLMIVNGSSTQAKTNNTNNQLESNLNYKILKSNNSLITQSN